MKLHLIDKSIVEITRHTCAHYMPSKYNKNGVCNWNINPIQIINDKAPGFFAIGKWGCDGYHNDCGEYVRTPENFESLIPVSSVVKITESNIWG